jgi:hypothetical protein
MTQRPAGWIAAALALAGGASVLLPHCDSVAPLAYVATLPDVEVPDHVDESRVEACRECFMGDAGPCRPLYDMCLMADPRCQRGVACLTDSFCWASFTDLTKPPPCVDECFADAGIVSVNDVAAAAGGLYLCLVSPGPCAAECTNAIVADAGTGDARSE